MFSSFFGVKQRASLGKKEVTKAYGISSAQYWFIFPPKKPTNIIRWDVQIRIMYVTICGVSTHFITRKYASTVQPKRHTWLGQLLYKVEFLFSFTYYIFKRFFFFNKRLQKLTKKFLRGFQNQRQTFNDLSKVLKTLIPMWKPRGQGAL